MKNIKKLPIAIAFLVAFMVSIIPTYAAVPAIVTTESDRTDTFWATGASGTPSSFNPWLDDPEPFATLMFETLYAFNSKTQEFVPVIGLDEPTWSNGGRNITIDLNPNAKWSDGTTIDSEDVVKSYEMAGAQPKFMKEFPKRFENITVVDVDTVNFALLVNASYSKMALNFLSRDVPILPWDGVYEEINSTLSSPVNGSLVTFKNDWLDSAFDATWKVASGPYTPVYKDALVKTSLYAYRNDWWGNATGVDIYADIPNWDSKLAHPKFVGHRVLGDNVDKDNNFRKGTVDLHAGAYLEIWTAWESAGAGAFANYINSYYLQEPPYVPALGSLMNVAFNHVKGAPFNYTWFREGLAWAINYDPIPGAAASGYWKRAMPGFLDDKAPTHAPFSNAIINAAYMRSYNITKATEIFTTAGAVKGTDGIWEFGGADLSGYKMITPLGWGDAGTFTDMICADFTAFGVPVTPDYVAGWDSDWSLWEDPIKNKEYEIMMSTGGSHNILDPMLFYKGYQDEPSWGKNTTGWYFPAFNTLFDQLETEGDPVTYANILDAIQLQFATEIPEIPCFVNSLWYFFSDYYWDGMIHALNDYQQITTTSTNDQFVMKQRMILNLVSTGRAPPGGGIPWTGLEIFMLIGLVSTIILAGYKIKTRK